MDIASKFTEFAQQQLHTLKDEASAIWSSFDWAPVVALKEKTPANATDEELAAVERTFIAHDNDSSLFSRQGVVSENATKERFVYLCELIGFKGTREEALCLEDFWEMAEAAGIGRAQAVEASQAAYEVMWVDAVLRDVIFECHRELNVREQRRRDAVLDVNGEKCVVLKKTEVLWSGWECDNVAWAVVKDGKPTLVTTNHGGIEIGNIELLKAKLKEYQTAIENTQQLLDLVCTKD